MDLAGLLKSAGAVTSLLEITTTYCLICKGVDWNIGLLFYILIFCLSVLSSFSYDQNFRLSPTKTEQLIIERRARFVLCHDLMLCIH